MAALVNNIGCFAKRERMPASSNLYDEQILSGVARTDESFRIWHLNER
jgi:hypothetical protein